MSERDLTLEEIFNFTKAGGKSSLCEVKFCRNRKLPGRRLCAKCKHHAWRVRNPMRSAFRVIKDRASLKKIPFTITFDDFREICEATGYIEGKGNFASDLHLDRIDARKGYEVGNLRVITCSDNSRKGSYEKKIQLSNGRWVTLQEIGLGVPLPPLDDPEDDEFFNSLWSSPEDRGEPDFSDDLPDGELPF